MTLRITKTEGSEMAIDGKIKVKSIESITPYGDGWNRHMEVEVNDLDLAATVDIDEVINEYSKEDILEAICDDFVTEWIERQTGMKLVDPE